MLHAPAMEQRTEAAARGRARAAAVNARDVATEPLVVGNQASLRRLGAPQLVRPSRMPMLQRTCAGGGACADCNDEKDAFQAKLAVNEPGDEYEQQADRVADQVMRMPEPPEGAHRKVEAASLQRHASDTAISEDVQLIVAEALRSPGQPLDAETRAFIEPRFGVDFGAVLVHSNAKAAASARALDAVAYTVGRDLVFADGCYAPCTSGGRRLLAHELTHTIQQGGVVGPTDHAVAQRQDYRSDSTPPVDEESLPAGAPPLIKPVSTSSPPQSTQEYFYYDRKNFDGNFDAEVQPFSRLTTLIIRLKFEPLKLSDERLNAFKSNFKAAVEQIWSYQYTLASVCMGDRFRARVSILTDASDDAHAIISLRPDDQFASTTSKYPSESQYKEGDYLPQEKRQKVQEPGKPGEIKERTFYQTTSAHEFGHLMGLHDMYGSVVTPEQAMDIMGVGNYVSRSDYEPFVKIMSRYGQDSLPPTCNKWRVESAD